MIVLKKGNIYCSLSFIVMINQSKIISNRLVATPSIEPQSTNRFIRRISVASNAIQTIDNEA